MRPVSASTGAPLLGACLLSLADCTPPPPLAVTASAAGGECRAEVGGRTLTMDQLGAAARAWRGRPVRVEGGAEVPYKCLGATIYVLQRAGVKRVGFLSEPPR